MRPTTQEQVDKYLLEKAARETKSSLDGLDYFCLILCVIVALEAAFGYWLVSQLPKLPLPPIR